MAKLAAYWKWFGSKNSSLLEVYKGVAAELAAYSSSSLGSL
jgi:hypothetical protein